MRITNSKQPLAEVFGFPTNNLSKDAQRYRKYKLCPYNNKVPNCTKDKADNPLGVCSIFHGENTAITCPVRFRQAWIIAEDAANFFFKEGTKWTSLTEVKLNDKNGRSAGNIDLVIAAYDSEGRVTDFGALEIQAVYISGNVRRPFEKYISNPVENTEMDWRKRSLFPRPDYLSSSRKRLVPQLLFKGGILNSWKKKIAVALDKGFYETLPDLRETKPDSADVLWLVYDLKLDDMQNRFILKDEKKIYTSFTDSLTTIITPNIGDVRAFEKILQGKLDQKLENGNKPDTQLLDLGF